VVLAKVADVLMGVLRETDSAGRLGGDEFAVLLPHTGEHQARTVASRIVLAVRTLAPEHGPSRLPISVSIGIARITGTTQHVKEVLAAADSAMYHAKRRGGDSAALSSDQPEAGAGSESTSFSSHDGSGRPPD
jgi:diguanylate cyclase (GGDEF)-like protein